MKLELVAWGAGALSAGIFAYLAFRASLMFWNAEKARERAEQTGGPRTRRLFDGISRRLKTAAGWRRQDHYLISAAIMFLVINQLMSLFQLVAKP